MFFRGRAGVTRAVLGGCRANFGLPNRIVGNPNFGRISSARNPREMQFGVRFAF